MTVVSVRNAALQLVDALTAVTLAPRCAACGEPLECPTTGCVCEPCWSAAAAVPSILWFSEHVASARAGGDFDGALRGIVHAFKYEGRRSLAAPLAQMMRNAGGDIIESADLIVPVPLHPWRYLRRGFNQADDLARGLGLPVVRALWRARATALQSGLTAAARRRNVRQAFRLSPLMRHGARRAVLRDRVVVLVDDVRTTGATLNACAEVLKTAGAAEVRALTAAARDLS
jgi:ComF family protein